MYAPSETSKRSQIPANTILSLDSSAATQSSQYHPMGSVGHPTLTGLPQMLPTSSLFPSSSNSFTHHTHTPMQTNHNEVEPSGSATTSNDIPMTPKEEDEKRKEIYSYEAPYTLFASSWSCATDPQRRYRLAVSSFIEEYSNKISIVQLDEEGGALVMRSTFDHPYPATNLQWIPDTKGSYPDLIATSGDYLRLWRIGADNQAKIEALLSANRTTEYCAPLTNFDWNELEMNWIVTCSIDTTCSVWQLETNQVIGSTKGSLNGTVKTQLIAHDKEVFDVKFSKNNKNVFASVGADGSCRLFDLRDLAMSTIVYEEESERSLLRIGWNRLDNNYLATFAAGSKEVVILDMRLPCLPVARLSNHGASINGFSWAPHSANHICTAGDDSQALIWDIHDMPNAVDDPILAYKAGGEVNQIHWSSSFHDWISICYNNKVEILRV